MFLVFPSVPQCAELATMWPSQCKTDTRHNINPPHKEAAILKRKMENRKKTKEIPKHDRRVAPHPIEKADFNTMGTIIAYKLRNHPCEFGALNVISLHM